MVFLPLQVLLLSGGRMGDCLGKDCGRKGLLNPRASPS